MAPQQPTRRLDGIQSPVPRPHFEITAEAVWFRMQEAARRDGVDLRDLGELAKQHPDVRDAILLTANNAERGPVRPFDDVTRAMVFIGLSRLRRFITEKAESSAARSAAAASKLASS